jgi:hypothetical protein
MIPDQTRFKTIREFAKANPYACICDRSEQGEFVREEKVSGFGKMEVVKIYKCKRCGNEKVFP